MDSSRIKIILKGKRAVVTKSTIVQAVRLLSQDSTVSLLSSVQELANWAYEHYTSEVTDNKVILRIEWVENPYKGPFMTKLSNVNKSERVIMLCDWNLVDSTLLLSEFVKLIRKTPFVEIISNKSIDDFI